MYRNYDKAINRCLSIELSSVTSQKTIFRILESWPHNMKEHYKILPFIQNQLHFRKSGELWPIEDLKFANGSLLFWLSS